MWLYIFDEKIRLHISVFVRTQRFSHETTQLYASCLWRFSGSLAVQSQVEACVLCLSWLL